MIIERIPLSCSFPFDPNAAALHARVDDDAEYLTLVTRLGWSAATELEQYAQIALLFQTIRLTLPQWRGGRGIDLPIGPVTEDAPLSVMVNGLAVDGASLITGSRPGVRFAESMPSGLIVIEYRAGFGEDATSLPPDLAHAINDQVLTSFDETGTGGGKTNGMSMHMARIAARYRRVRL